MALLVLVLLSCTSGTNEPTEKAGRPRKLLTDAELWDVYYRFIETMKPYGIPVDRAEHGKLIRPTMTHHKSFDPTLHLDRITSIDSTGDLIGVSIDSYTGEIRAFWLWKVLMNLEGKKVEPKLSRREVRAMTEKYLALNTTIPLKEYSVTVDRKESHWWVLFVRKLNGYKFMLDIIIVEYSEQYGLLSYLNQVFSDECDTEVKVSKKEAIALANKYLPSVKQKTLNIPMQIREVGDPKIVNPVYMRSRIARNKVPLSELRKTRLAWPITYEDAPEARVNMPVILVIYVDAITGELLYHVAVH